MDVEGVGTATPVIRPLLVRGAFADAAAGQLDGVGGGVRSPGRRGRRPQ